MGANARVRKRPRLSMLDRAHETARATLGFRRLTALPSTHHWSVLHEPRIFSLRSAALLHPELSTIW
jgi:hypothetical protein